MATSKGDDHETNRKKICLVCWTKPLKWESNMRQIQGEVLDRVKKYFMSNYKPTDDKLPSGICSRCRLIFLEIWKDVCYIALHDF